MATKETQPKPAQKPKMTATARTRPPSAPILEDNHHSELMKISGTPKAPTIHNRKRKRSDAEEQNESPPTKKGQNGSKMTAIPKSKTSGSSKPTKRLSDSSKIKLNPKADAKSPPKSVKKASKEPSSDATEANDEETSKLCTSKPKVPHKKANQLASTPQSNPFPLIAGVPARYSSPDIQRLAKLPVLQVARLREGKTFKPSPVSHEEAFMLQERGTVAGKACDHCIRKCGIFADCVSLEGFLDETCANCHYRGSGNPCSFFNDYELAVAVATAAAMSPPEVKFSAPANYYGGSLAKGGGVLKVLAEGPPSRATPGMKARRVTPTLIGTSDDFESMKSKVQKMSAEERQKEKNSLQLKIAAIVAVNQNIAQHGENQKHIQNDEPASEKTQNPTCTSQGTQASHSAPPNPKRRRSI